MPSVDPAVLRLGRSPGGPSGSRGRLAVTTGQLRFRGCLKFAYHRRDRSTVVTRSTPLRPASPPPSARTPFAMSCSPGSRSGVDIVTVAELMGYASLERTRLYTRPRPGGQA